MLLLPTGELDLLPAVEGRPVNSKTLVHNLFAVKLCAATLDESPYLALRLCKLQAYEKIDNCDARFSLSALHFRSAIRRNNSVECEIVKNVAMSQAMKTHVKVTRWHFATLHILHRYLGRAAFDPPSPPTNNCLIVW